MSTINAVGTSLSGQSGTGAFAGTTSASLVTPKIGTINDTNGVNILTFVPTASAVNYLEIINNTTTNPPALLSAGSDSNVGFVLQTQSAGVFTAKTTASVNAWTFATGTAYQHLTQFQFSNTAATRSITFPDASGTLALTSDTIPSGTIMLFAQTAAPTGWTKNTTDNNNSALRLVTGSVSTGGTVDFTTAFASQAVAGTNSGYTLTTPDIPAHTHTFNFGTGVAVANTTLNVTVSGVPSLSSGSTGGGGSHTHTFTGTAINLAVKYVDIIRASKD